MIAALTKRYNRQYFSSLIKTLKYSLYVITHPFDGFWDLTHENRGSVQAANVMVILLILHRLLSLQYTSFMFISVHWQYINLFLEALSIVIPIALWCIANWSWTTLMNGKGRLKDIYIATAYAFTPQIIIGFSTIIISNFITLEEKVFYTVLNTFAIVWSVFLVISAMAMIHDYSFSKSIFVCILTIVGIAVILFLFILCFSLVSDAIAYFVSMYKEIVYRVS